MEYKGILSIDPRKGYICKCPQCGKEFVSTQSISVAEEKYRRHNIRVRDPMRSLENLDGKSST
jgi:hypothetical protein